MTNRTSILERNSRNKYPGRTQRFEGKVVKIKLYRYLLTLGDETQTENMKLAVKL